MSHSATAPWADVPLQDDGVEGRIGSEAPGIEDDAENRGDFADGLEGEVGREGEDAQGRAGVDGAVERGAIEFGDEPVGGGELRLGAAGGDGVADGVGRDGERRFRGEEDDAELEEGGFVGEVVDEEGAVSSRQRKREQQQGRQTHMRHDAGGWACVTLGFDF